MAIIPRRSPIPLQASRSTPKLSCPTWVAERLLAYLDLPGLRYREPPQLLPDGWDAFTYALQLQEHKNLPRRLRGPLILRIYSSQQGLPRARREVLFQRRLRRLGFPVPRVLHLETASDWFGGPFLLRTRVPGQSLFTALLYRPWRIFWVPARLGRLHARLHKLPCNDFRAPRRPFLIRRLEELDALIRTHQLAGLRPGLDWLFHHQPPEEETVDRILHLDWHLMNVMEAEEGALSILDWTEADVGDRHADVAMALEMLDTAPPHGEEGLHGVWEPIAVPVGRFLMRFFYLHAYRKQLPLDRRRLTYYRAWAALWRLAFFGRWLHAGPASTGSNPVLLERLGTGYLRALCRSFYRRTGVRVHLEPPAP